LAAKSQASGSVCSAAACPDRAGVE
jgi:hypothetical protein